MSSIWPLGSSQCKLLNCSQPNYSPFLFALTHLLHGKASALSHGLLKRTSVAKSLDFAVLLHCSVASHLRKWRYDIGEFGELLKTSEEQTQVNNCPGDELPRTRLWQQ